MATEAENGGMLPLEFDNEAPTTMRSFILAQDHPDHHDPEGPPPRLPPPEVWWRSVTPDEMAVVAEDLAPAIVEVHRQLARRHGGGR